MSGETFGPRRPCARRAAVLWVLLLVSPVTSMKIVVAQSSTDGVAYENATTPQATTVSALRASLKHAEEVRSQYAAELSRLKARQEAKEAQPPGGNILLGPLIGTRIGAANASGVASDSGVATPAATRDSRGEAARLTEQLAAVEGETRDLAAQIANLRQREAAAAEFARDGVEALRRDPQDRMGNFEINKMMSDLNNADALQRALHLQHLLARGAALARADPVANALRFQQPVGDARNGFDLGMAVAEGHTMPGPGKQAVHDSLSLAGKGGFSVAVSHTLARNRAKLTDLAPRGLLIANQDPQALALRNLQPDASARLGFDIGMAAAEGHTVMGPGKQRTHDSLYPEERAGFSAAVTFSLARNRQKLLDMAPRGEALASEDPVAIKLREQQPEGPLRLGFDIGMAAAEGQTAPGPGKQRMQESLYAAEQPGFAAAVRFSIDRNRNAERAAIGAEIARTDPLVAEARLAEADAFYWLGFDIATGIFGDPALGAQGNTATGPGSLGIRDSLTPAAQRGFNAAVALHLGRRYGN